MTLNTPSSWNFSFLILFPLVAGAYRNFIIMAKQKKRYNRLKLVLTEKEKTNVWLAEKLGINRTTVSKWCTNDNQPTIENLFKIAEALNVEVCELLIKIKK